MRVQYTGMNAKLNSDARGKVLNFESTAKQQTEYNATGLINNAISKCSTVFFCSYKLCANEHFIYRNTCQK